MPPTCKTCKRDDVQEINKQLVAGVPLRTIANQIGDNDHLRLLRHKDSCIPALFTDRDNKRREGLLNDIDAVKAEIEQVKAEFGDNGTLRDKLIGRKFTAIELEAKLTGAFTKDKENPATLEQQRKDLRDHYHRMYMAEPFNYSDAEAQATADKYAMLYEGGVH